jgi:nucleotide-binding universal stress UspA family protein
LSGDVGVSSGRGPPSRLLRGSLTEQVIREADVPVLVVPAR